MARRGLAALIAGVVLGAAAPGVAQERWEGLRGVREVALETALLDAPGRLTDEALRGRVQGMMAQRRPGPWPRPGAADRLRVSVGVRRVGASELRGFWLPFSGAYGVGAVRLALERRVTLAGLASPVPGVVWQLERQVAGPWAQAEARVVEALEALVMAFLADCRRANP
jgi:hypothetical protein